MKSYTDLEQSKKLAEILPLKSADMYFNGHQSITNPKEWKYEDAPKVRGKYIAFDDKRIFYPCWSLAALLGVLESEIYDEDGNTYELKIEKEGTWWWIEYIERYGEASPIETNSTEELIDACYEMIVKLKELNLL